MRISDWSSDVCSSDLSRMRRSIQAPIQLSQVVLVRRRERCYDVGKDLRADDRGGDTGQCVERSRRGHRGIGLREVHRSEAGPGGKGCVSPGGSRWSTYHLKKKPKQRSKIELTR